MKVPTTASPPVIEGAVLPKPIGVGDRLANGATVLAVKPSPLMANSSVFLALSHQEFVTWVGWTDGTDTCWGHYFNDLGRALADFEARR